MKTRTIWSALVVLCITTGATAEELRIETEKTAFLPYEPVYVAVTYTGGRAIVPAPSTGDVALSVRNATTGKERRFQPAFRVSQHCVACSMQGAEMPRTRTQVFPITGDRSGWLFAEPGVYVVQAMSQDLTLRSNEVSIAIERPSRPEDMAAMERLGTTRGMLAFQILEGGDMFDEAMGTAKDLAAGNSSYRGAMRDLLVKAYSQMSYSRDKVRREPDLETAMKYYDPVKARTTGMLSKVVTLMLLNRRVKGLGLPESEYGISTEIAALKAQAGARVDLMTLPRAERLLAE